MGRRSGLTLVEILVVATLILVVGALGLNFFVNLTRASLRGLAKGAAEQQCVIIYQRLLRDLQSSSPNAISWQPDLGSSHLRAVAIQPIETFDNTGKIVYATQHLITYFWEPSTSLLLRREWVTNPPGVTLQINDPQRLTGATLENLFTAAGAKVMKFDSITAFDLGSTIPPPNLSSPLRLTLGMTLADNLGMKERYFLSRQLVLNNPAY